VERTPIGRYGGPGAVADLALFLASESSFISGAPILVDGGDGARPAVPPRQPSQPAHPGAESRAMSSSE
jgi:hypothetical protein